MRSAMRLLGLFVVGASLLSGCGDDDADRAERSTASSGLSSSGWMRAELLADGWSANVIGTSLDEPVIYAIGRHRLDDDRSGYLQHADVRRVDLESGETTDLPTPPVTDAITTGTAVAVGGSLFVLGVDCPAGGDPDSGGFGCRFREATWRALRLDDGADTWTTLELPPTLADARMGPGTMMPIFAPTGSEAASTLFLLARPEPMAAGVTVLPLDTGSGRWGEPFEASVVQSCSDGEQLSVLTAVAVTPFAADEAPPDTITLTSFGPDGRSSAEEIQLSLSSMTDGERSALDLLSFQLHCAGPVRYLSAAPGGESLHVWRRDAGAPAWEPLEPPPGRGARASQAVPDGLCVVRGAQGGSATATVSCTPNDGGGWVANTDLPIAAAGGAPHVFSAGDALVVRQPMTDGTEPVQALRPRT